jgi:hypothetical protein
VPPVAGFSVTPTTVARGTGVNFDGSTSHDGELPGGIATYAWDFDGDGSTDQTTTVPTVTHAYATLGSFSAKLVVTDSDDGMASSPASQPVAVQNVSPSAALTASPVPVVQGKPVTFSGSASSDPDGSIANFKWDLDANGKFETDTGSVPTVTRTFAAAGSFPVGLQVTDSDGATSVANLTVQVVPPPLKLVLGFPNSVRLKTLLAGRVRGNAACGRACVVKLKVQLSRKVARKLHAPAVIAVGTVRISGTARKGVRIVLGRKARKALTRARPKLLTLNLSATATATGAKTSRAKRLVRVRR